MADITRETIRNGSLLSSTNRVEAPFICVSIGGYTFGVYEHKGKYPNYVQDLTVKKINGTVNQYSLKIMYPITESNDPNFFEKLFAHAGLGTKITISYGDSMLPEYVYRDEECIITKVRNSFNWNSSTITYTIDAVSASKTTLGGTYSFPARKNTKPSDVIKELLKSNQYHLTEVFVGMKDSSLVDSMNLIAGDDAKINIRTCTNMSILEYISFLVSCMIPVGSSGNDVIKSTFYSMTTYEDTSGVYGGAYFKVQKIQKAASALNQLCTYEVDLGYPTASMVIDFQVANDENWSIFYNYNQSLNDSDYLRRIDSNGREESVYSPLLANTKYNMNDNDATWWTKVTQYPIKATLKIKGLLRPVVLMQYIKLNVWFYGNKHISSGYYIITSQTDQIGVGGYYTTLELLRVSGDEE